MKSWLKQNWIKVGVGILILGVLFFVKEQEDVVPQTANIENTDNIDMGKFADAIKEVESGQPSRIGESPSDEEIYNNPYVKHIRVALNGYLAGTNNGVEEGALDAGESTPECGLNTFDKSYYKSKFIVYDVGDNDYGGVQTNIVFVDKPDTIFWAWTYRYAGDEDEYVLRGFCKNGPPNGSKEKFLEMIRAFLKSGESRFSF